MCVDTILLHLQLILVSSGVIYTNVISEYLQNLYDLVNMSEQILLGCQLSGFTELQPIIVI
jgi:hypothetical protein